MEHRRLIVGLSDGPCTSNSCGISLGLLHSGGAETWGRAGTGLDEHPRPKINSVQTRCRAQSSKPSSRAVLTSSIGEGRSNFLSKLYR